MFNDKYLAEVNFWREFLAQSRPRIILNFRNQVAVVGIDPVQVKIKWPGIPQDAIHVDLSIPEDDLFTSAELYESLSDEGISDIDQGDFTEEDEE